jgi:hypothetical protein
MSIATIAPTMAVWAPPSYGGDTSTASPPITLTPLRDHRISRCSADVSPPGAPGFFMVTTIADRGIHLLAGRVRSHRVRV